MPVERVPAQVMRRLRIAAVAAEYPIAAVAAVAVVMPAAVVVVVVVVDTLAAAAVADTGNR